MKKLTQSIYFALLVLLFAFACYGFTVGMKGEEKQEEVHGVVQEKYQNQIVKNTLSLYESETQYWVKLNNGRQIQLPAYLYQNVAKGEEVSLVKAKGGTVYLSENVYPR